MRSVGTSQMNRLADEIRERRARSSSFEYFCFTAPPLAALALLVWFGGGHGAGQALAIPMLIGGLLGALFILSSDREPWFNLNRLGEIALSLLPAAILFVVFSPDWRAVVAVATFHLVEGEIERRTRPSTEQVRTRVRDLRRRFRRAGS